MSVRLLTMYFFPIIILYTSIYFWVLFSVNKDLSNKTISRIDTSEIQSMKIKFDNMLDDTNGKEKLIKDVECLLANRYMDGYVMYTISPKDEIKILETNIRKDKVTSIVRSTDVLNTKGYRVIKYTKELDKTFDNSWNDRFKNKTYILVYTYRHHGEYNDSISQFGFYVDEDGGIHIKWNQFLKHNDTLYIIILIYILLLIYLIYRYNYKSELRSKEYHKMVNSRIIGTIDQIIGYIKNIDFDDIFREESGNHKLRGFVVRDRDETRLPEDVYHKVKELGIVMYSSLISKPMYLLKERNDTIKMIQDNQKLQVLQAFQSFNHDLNTVEMVNDNSVGFYSKSFPLDSGSGDGVVYNHNTNKYYMITFDVSGHGLTASFTAIALITAIKCYLQYTKDDIDLIDVMKQIQNNLIYILGYKSLEVCICEVSPEDNTLNILNCGNIFYTIKFDDGSVEHHFELENKLIHHRDKIVDIEYHVNEYNLDTISRVLFSTDGFYNKVKGYDDINQRYINISVDEYKGIIERHIDMCSYSDVLEGVIKEIEDVCDYKDHDDRTLSLIEVNREVCKIHLSNKEVTK